MTGPAETTVLVSLVIRGFSSTPEQLTERLARRPTRTGTRGDERRFINAAGIRSVRRLEHSYWELRSALPVDASLDDQIRDVLGLVASVRDILLGMAAPAELEISCTIIPDPVLPGLLISATSLAGIVAIGARLRVDIVLTRHEAEVDGT